MIVRDRPTLWQLAFVTRGSVVRKVAPQMLLVAAVSLAVVLLRWLGLLRLDDMSPAALSVIGSALAIFSSFRNAAAYDRWWEARKKIGQVTCAARGLAREAVSYISTDSGADPAAVETGRRIALRCIATLAVLREFLRGEPLAPDSVRYLAAAEAAALATSANPPLRLLDFFSADIARLLATERISPTVAEFLETRVTELTCAFTGAERVKSTPMPFTYTLLVHRTAYAFCFLLPFGLADSSGWWTPLIAAVVSYTFFALDAVGDELACPYDARLANTIPLNSLATTLEINILQLLGTPTDHLPEPPLPKNYILT